MTAPQRRYDLVVFDLDGTLADTKRDLAGAVNHALATLGLPTHPVETVVTMVGGGSIVLLQRALGPEKGKDPATVEKAAGLFIPFYRDHMLDNTRPYDGMEETLHDLAAAGVKMAVATNKARLFTVGIVEVLFPGLFDPIIACGEDVPRKPDPSCISRAMARHPGVPRERILFVGDSVVDVETARTAGVDVLSVTWGFGKKEALSTEKPTFLADRVSQVKAVILREDGGA